MEPVCLVFASAGPARRLARELPGWSVRVVDEAGEFARRLRTERPDLVVVCAPPAAPTDLALAIAERAGRPDLRAVLVDAPSEVTERLDALAGGWDEALPATMPDVELAGRLTLLAHRAARENPRPVRLAVAPGYELDLLARELLRNGQRIALRPKEFALLTELARAPGVVRDRRELLDRVWGARSAVDPRTLDVHVRRLRMKIESTPDRPAHLITVRGVGYRLDTLPL